MKKLLVLILVSVFTLSFLVQGWSKEQLRFWTMWTGPTQLPPQQEWVRDFNKLHPDVEVVLEQVPWGEYYEKYLTAVAAKNPPDLGVLPPETSVQFGAAGFLEPLDDVMAELKSNLYPSLVQLHTYKGHTWAAPHVNYCQVLFVRKDWLKDTGIAAPTSQQKAWTWERLVTVARKMTKAGRWGLAGEICALSRSHSTEHAVAMALVRHGTQYRDEDGNIIFDNPKTVAAIRELADLLLKYKVIPPATASYVSGEERMLFQTGKVGMLGASSGNYSLIKEEAPDVFSQLLILPYPTGPAGGANWISPDGIGIFKGSKNVAMAKEFIKFYLQDENIKKWAKATDGLCATISGNKDPFFDTPIFRVQEQQIAWGWGCRTNGKSVTPSDGEVIGMYVFQDLMQDIVVRKLSVEQAVKSATEKLKNLPSIKQRL